MSTFLFVKALHMGCALCSISGFILRGIWIHYCSGHGQLMRSRVLTHAVDTLLLVSAIYLAIQLQQMPLADAWLTAKVCALFVYIGLGMIAFRFGRTKQERFAAWLAAIVVFLYIVGVALTKNVIPLF